MKISAATMLGVAMVALASALTACSTVDRVVLAEPPIAATAAGPAPVAGDDRFFNEDDSTKEVSLSYGVANSDEMLLGMHCTPGGGESTLVRSVPHGWPASILLESGGDTESYSANTEEDPVQGGQFLTAKARTTDPVFKRFRRLGWLAVIDEQNRRIMAPQSASAPRVEAYFAACG